MIEKLEKQNLNSNVFSVYDYNGLTIQELLSQFFTKINECVDVSNATNELAEWLVNEGLAIEVVKKIDKMLQEGTFDTIINENIFTELNNTKLAIDNIYFEKNKLVLTNGKNAIKKLEIPLEIKPEVHFLYPVEGTSGDCSIIKDSTGSVHMVDCGIEGQFAHIDNQLRNLGVTKIDNLFITHSHSDHIGNAPQIIEKYKPNKIYFKEVTWSNLPTIETEWQTEYYHNLMVQSAIQHKVEIIKITTDTTIQLNDREYITTYGATYFDYSDYNNMSLVFKYTYKNKTNVLFCGDITNKTEGFLKGKIGKCQVVKAPHHGLEGSSTIEFLDELRGELIILGSIILHSGDVNGGREDVALRYKFYYGKIFDVWKKNTGGSLILDNGSIIHSMKETVLGNMWLEVDGASHYFKDDGSIAANEVVRSGTQYYYIQDWSCVYNDFVKANKYGDYYYARIYSGDLLCNEWLEHESSHYFFKSNCLMARNETLNINGKIYRFGENGVCENPNGE